MEISDVRVKLMDNATDRLKAVCSVTFDGEFVVRDLKVVDGTNGLFVAMPSRKLAVHCPQCRHKNHLRARFCNDCGAKLPPNRVAADANGRVRLHRDIAHPINPAFRELMQTKLIERYTAERELAQQPGYKPADVEAELDEVADVHEAQDTQAPRDREGVGRADRGSHAPRDQGGSAETEQGGSGRVCGETAVAPELSEYDALIAGLRSGSDSPPSPTDAPRSSPRTQPPPRAPRPGPAPKRSDSDSSRQPSRSSNGGRGERSSSGPPRQPNRRPAPAPVVESGWRPPADDDLDEPTPAAPVRDTPTAEVEPAPAKPTVERQPYKPAPSSPARSAPPPVRTADDNDAPFGAGIL